jgi:hypothetical protein
VLIYLNGAGDTKSRKNSKSASVCKSGSVQASPALQGGETIFYGATGHVIKSVAPLGGMALLHLHGEDCLEHEGATVKSGVKYVLRSDVVFA